MLYIIGWQHIIPIRTNNRVFAVNLVALRFLYVSHTKSTSTREKIFAVGKVAQMPLNHFFLGWGVRRFHII